MTYNHITVGKSRGHVSTPNAKITGPQVLVGPSSVAVVAEQAWSLVCAQRSGPSHPSRRLQSKREEPPEALHLETGEMLLLLS